MSDHVTITRQQGAQFASFDTISASQSEMVFWKNEDSEPHHPIFSTVSPPLTLANQVGPHATSDSLQPALALSAFYPASGPIPLTQGKLLHANYTCSLHPGETGVINVYADFYPQPSQLPGFTRGVAGTANLTTGGMPNFTFNVSNSNLPPSLTVTIVDSLQGPAVTGTPGSGDAGNFAFDLYCQDSGGNNVTQTYLLTVA
jgi:hypothetical protein